VVRFFFGRYTRDLDRFALPLPDACGSTFCTIRPSTVEADA
jgi:hypothetical protein